MRITGLVTSPRSGAVEIYYEVSSDVVQDKLTWTIRQGILASGAPKVYFVYQGVPVFHEGFEHRGVIGR
jgi:hypothetical protein